MKQTDWISVEDRLPRLYLDAGCIKFSGEVLLCVNNCKVLTANLVCDKSNNTMFWSASRGGSYNLEEATHWQEIVLPKKVKK